MDLVSGLFQLTNEQRRQLAKLKSLAVKAEKGTSYFYKFSACPVIGCYLITGDLEQNGTDEKEIDMKLVNQPDYYLAINGCDSLVKDAYNDYVEKKLHLLAKDQSKGILIHNLPNYKFAYESVIKVLDSAVKDFHGVMCFQDGNIENDNFENVFFLHVCDVINIYVNQMKGKETTVLLKTSLLPSIDYRMKDILFEKKLKGTDLEVFNFQIDIFYYIYCYHGNRSFIPVRTHIRKDSDMFKKSKFFMNDSHYVRHQNGKLHTINHVSEDCKAKFAYRSV